MLEVSRLLEVLAPHGFSLAWERWLGHQFNYDFVRPSPIDGAFEHIDIDSMGKRGEVVYCRVLISPVRGHRILFKPMPEVDELVTELGDAELGDADLGDAAAGRGCALIESPSTAIHWELQVAEIAPQRVRSLAQVHAQQVALSTSAAREAAAQYVRRIREISDERVMEYLAYQLRSRATPAQQRQADRPCGAGAVWADVREAIECAALAVALYGEEIDREHNGFIDDSAGKSPELKLRLNIIADMLRCGIP